MYCWLMYFFSSERRHTRCALGTGVQTCALPIYEIVMFDMAVTQALTPFREGPLLSFFLWITRFGDTATLVAVTIVSAGFLWADRRTAYAWQIGSASCREGVCPYV